MQQEHMADADRKGMGTGGRLEQETGTGRRCAGGVGGEKTLVGLGPKPCLRRVPAAQLPHLFFKEDACQGGVGTGLGGWCPEGSDCGPNARAVCWHQQPRTTQPKLLQPHAISSQDQQIVATPN